jgi:hypothetical protein
VTALDMLGIKLPRPVPEVPVGDYETMNTMDVREMVSKIETGLMADVPDQDMIALLTVVARLLQARWVK